MSASEWMAWPPEVHSSLLSDGPGPASLLVAAAAWNALSDEYFSAAVELESVLATVGANVWQGPSAEDYVNAHQSYLAWLNDTGARSAAAAAQQQTAAAAYTAAVAAMPTIAELAANHFAHGALIATNFFGINTIPIALNEADYAIMWIQAATVMATYQGTCEAALASVPRDGAPPIVLKTPSVVAAVDPGQTFDQLLRQIIAYLESNPIAALTAVGVFAGVTGYEVASALPYVPFLLLPLFIVATTSDHAPTSQPMDPPDAVPAHPPRPVAASTKIADHAHQSPPATASSTSGRSVIHPLPGSSTAAPTIAAPSQAPPDLTYLLNDLSPDDRPGPPRIDHGGTSSATESSAAASAVTATRLDTRPRRRRRAEIHSPADEFASMSIQVVAGSGSEVDREAATAPPGSQTKSGAVNTAAGAGQIGRPVGLVTLPDDQCRTAPKFPLLPRAAAKYDDLDDTPPNDT